MTENQLLQIFQKTYGHCHFCGDRLTFSKRGWKAWPMAGFWEVDHVYQKARGGSRSIENCLPACTRCNRLRWHRTGDQVRELLLLGLIAQKKIRKGSAVGKTIEELKVKYLEENRKRRESS